MKIPIIDIAGLTEKGIIDPSIVLHDAEKLPPHITTAIMLFDNKPHPELLEQSTLLFNFVGASYRLPQYVYKNKIVLSFAPLGSSAAGGLLEELIALGIKRVIACGSSGLIGEFDSSEFLLVEKAIRDEGLSYHYMEPSLYVNTSQSLNQLIKDYFTHNNIHCHEGIVWTTDAFYRETKSRIELRKSQGAVAVEMECAGLAAVAQFRGIEFSQLLYFSDIVNQDEWSGFREDRTQVKDHVNQVVLTLAMNL